MLGEGHFTRGLLILCVCTVTFESVRVMGYTKHNREIKSNSITRVNRTVWSSSSSRSKRATSELEADIVQLLLDLHNNYRRQEGSSNMEKLKWNSDLADMGQEWANRCKWGHGQPEVAQKPFEYIGQNLYAYENGIDYESAMFAFYDEKQFYNYYTFECTPGEMCGHYTQVVWAPTREVGCGMQVCPTVSYLNNAYYLVCNYGPGGNFKDEKIYRKGEACSQCESGHNWCDDGLCNSECNSHGQFCKCDTKCKHCGTFNAQDCSCTCLPGRGTADCSEECTNINDLCGANPGWPKFWCEGSGFNEVVNRNCHLLCGKCEKVDPSEEQPECKEGQLPGYATALIVIVVIGVVAAVVVAVFLFVRTRRKNATKQDRNQVSATSIPPPAISTPVSSSRPWMTESSSNGNAPRPPLKPFRPHSPTSTQNNLVVDRDQWKQSPSGWTNHYQPLHQGATGAQNTAHLSAPPKALKPVNRPGAIVLPNIFNDNTANSASPSRSGLKPFRPAPLAPPKNELNNGPPVPKKPLSPPPKPPTSPRPLLPPKPSTAPKPLMPKSNVFGHSNTPPYR